MSASSTSDDDNDENRLNLTESQLLAAQKSLISKHPLFPVLVYVLERCEQATLNPPLLTSNAEENATNSFEQNLKVFLAKNPTLLTTLKDEQDETSALIDSFYIDAMQVLRIHLLELDKVNDLCRDFCQRYIACLKVKLNANNIFTDDEDDEDDDEDDDDEIDAEFDDAESNLDDEFDSSDDDEQLMFNSKASSRKATMFNENANHFTGQTPLSQIIGTSSTAMADSSSSSMLFESFCTKRRKTSSNLSASKRGVLPKSATSIMRSWLFQHIVHPYPTEDEKRAISQKTNLSLLQVNNWFINARRRILQPMLEASNPDLAANKKKKRPSDSTADEHGATAAAATQNRQMSNINRYWPANLVQFDLTTSEQRKK